MSISRNQQETNYWPSISDMFLVFFVLALAVASNMILAKEEGDKFAMDDVVNYSIELSNFTNAYLDEKKIDERVDELSEFKAEEYSYSNSQTQDADLRRLSSLWLDVHSKLRLCLGKTSIAEDDENDETEFRGIRRLARLVGVSYTDGAYDRQLRRILEKLYTLKPSFRPEISAFLKRENVLLRNEIDGLKKNDQTKENVELHSKIKNLQRQQQELENELRKAKRLVELQNNSFVSTLSMDGTAVSFQSGETVVNIMDRVKFSALIADLEKKLETRRKFQVDVIGHTDSSFFGSKYDNDVTNDPHWYNAGLGYQRARAFIAKIVETLRTKHTQTEIDTYLEFRPFSAAFSQPVKEMDIENKDKSRRVEVMIRDKETIQIKDII